jgi:hypothetical protein
MSKFVSSLFLAGALLCAAHSNGQAGQPTGSVMLPGSPAAGPFPEVVLFGFDNRAFPFTNHVETRLFTAQRRPQLVLPPGPPGSHDEAILYYGTVIRIGDVFHLWYNGNHGPMRPLTGFEREKTSIAYATSTDGVNWTKPNLGLVEFNGSKANNLVDFPDSKLWSTCAIIHEPEEPDPGKRFKMVYEAHYSDGTLCVASSADGLRWVTSPNNPRGPLFEMAGIVKHQGLYYVNGQASPSAHHATSVRRLVTFVSADFEQWSPIGAVGLDRGPDVTGPSTADALHQFEGVHLGAGLWNRGNVIVGIYGQWHGDVTGDRRRTVIDLGLAVTHDGTHYHEPIPGFRLIPAREQPYSPADVAPALMQGQGMENVGDRTLYWYSLWRGNVGSGVRLATWPRDRLGALQPFRPANARAISCAVQVTAPTPVHINATGLGKNGRLRIELLDEGFRPLPGYSGDSAALVETSGFKQPATWSQGAGLPVTDRPVRISVTFEGTRPEDVRLFAVYIGDSKR